MKKSLLLGLLLPAILAVLAFFPINNQPEQFHTDAERAFMRRHLGYFYPQMKNGPDDPHALIPIDSNILFPTAKVCGGCHGYDPNQNALVTSWGEDVNFYDSWRSTMMALSARDPFWRAKVTHESLVNPAHSLELQDKCTSCHAPAGHYQAKLKLNQEYYTLSDLYQDTLGLDGVTCQACHAQPQSAFLGNQHSGDIYFDTNNIRVAYGPFQQVFAPPMQQFVGITPLFSEHIFDAGICASCHTLITNSVDEAGQPTGSTFIEQATYHEWLNSRYDEDNDNISCQACHVPTLEDAVIISANYQFLVPRFPIGLHELAGANVTMLKLMKENRQALDITALPEHFDSTIAATLRMLQHQTLDLNLETGTLHGDSAHFHLYLRNKAGHKFPSGYPARRAWVEFVVKNQQGDTVFHSGRMAPDYTLPDEDSNFEPHYQLIDRPDQVQIYELVPGSVSGTFTNVLERGHIALKDNRLTPQGFRLDDPAYDTTRIVGAALTDPDFNRDPATGAEGTGADRLHFRIPTNGYTGRLTVTARVWYQSLPPKFVRPMFEWSSPEIDSFRVMFENADQSPVLVAEQTLDSVFVSPVSVRPAPAKPVRIYPSVSADGRLRIEAPESMPVTRVQVWDAAGRLWLDLPGPRAELQLPERKGLYFVAVSTRAGRKVEKVVRE